jgi:hypothetical protein
MPDARTENNRTDTLRLARTESMLEARPAPAPRPPPPTRASPTGPIGPAGPAGPTHTAEEMFLSPRVLDAGAFARYAETLRSIIGEARLGTRSLQDFSADAEQMIANCDKTGEQIKARIEAGARVVRMIDERADRAEKIIDTVRRELPDEARLRALIEPTVRQALESAQQRAGDIATETERRARAAATEIERKLVAMAARADEQAARLSTLTDTIGDRLDAFESHLDTLIARADQAANDFETRASAASQAANAELEPTLVRAAAATVEIDEAMARTWRQAEERAGDISDRLTPLQQACDQVLERLGLDSDEADPARSVMHRLESLIKRSEISLDGAQRVIGQVDFLRAQADEVRTTFGQWLLEAADRVDALEARRERLEGPLAAAADAVARISPQFADEIEQAAARLDRLMTEQTILRETVQTTAHLARQSGDELNNRSAQFKALIDGSVHTLSKRVEEAGLWLGNLILRAEAAAITLNPDARPPQPAAPQAVSPPQPIGQPRRPIAPPANSYGLPLPPSLPIDAQSFDGAEVVFGQPDRPEEKDL